MRNEKQTLKNKLLAIILLESSKPYKEMDSGLVTECVDFLMELEGEKGLTQSEIEQRVKDIPFKGKVTAINSHIKKKFRAKRLAVTAAVLAIIFALFSIIAAALGSSSIDLLKQMGHAIAEMFSGESVEQGGITIIKHNESKEYDSLEALFEEEEIDILYPTWLPENEEIVSVLYKHIDQSERYIIQTTNIKYNITVTLNSKIPEEAKSSAPVKEINNHKCYCDIEEGLVQALFEYNNMLYSIKSDTEENLFKTIENLKEIS